MQPSVGQWQITHSKSHWMLGRLPQCLKSEEMSDGETRRKESSSKGSVAAYKEPEGEHWETQSSDPWRSVHKWCCFLFPDRQHGVMPPTPAARASRTRSVTAAAPSQSPVRRWESIRESRQRATALAYHQRWEVKKYKYFITLILFSQHL